ncbi:chemotaxis protein [Xanthomonas arboricola]|uniref:Chemotaxis protein CheA n=1 Tax=Xanthomonas campestris pv. juglandis TaxID=195709 RepID=A0A7U7DBX0_XANCJ|nr:chemotaxis protein CheA [Xanthomonas arboricola]KOB00989.1 chemotaxis protein [Xanthomonas arboricola]KOB13169.1 chemotaxis protein [Xanthomonas arboricola]KOB33057.1 chemotaxis protein [Xanthomonas arboricola]MBB3847729.1 two-component system chemotaxis sensor kinase CheA [Xanthomonas arboricola]OAH87309.1 chemotaxis protein CheA [Xanthomonas arboricola pv. juglandis]
MSAVPDDIAADFIVEAQEILDRLGEQLVSLEQAPDEADQLNAVFRGFHTLKGGAGFLAIKPMVELCHAAEETLGMARSGQAVLQAHHFDAAQQSLDYLQAMLDAMGSGEPVPHAPASLIAQFDAKSGPPAVKAAPKAALAAVAASPHDDGHAPAPGAKAAPKAAAKGAEAEQTVRVDTKRLDAIVNLIGELVLSRNRLKTLRTRLRDEELDRAVSTLDIATARLQTAVMRTRMQPVSKVFSRFPKVARDVARTLSKEVELELIGAETELDRNLVEALADPLVHLVRNAIDHGIESPALREATGKPRSGHVRLSAQQEGDYVSIEIQDDGAGIDPERLREIARNKGLIDAEAAARLSTDECLHLIFMPGFSTKAEVTDISGRGVGMDVVQSRIRELSGQIQIQSELGRGSRFMIRVPLTLAILPTLLVQAGEAVYALPLARVVEVLHAPQTSLGWFDGRAVLDRRSHTLPLIDLRRWLGVPAEQPPLLTVVLLQAGETRFGLVVDQVRGREEVVIKPLPRALRGLPGYAGATLIGDGRMALILDVDGLRSSDH